jgi:hypothetical protein
MCHVLGGDADAEGLGSCKADVRCSMADGRLLMADGSWPLAAGLQMLTERRWAMQAPEAATGN